MKLVIDIPDEMYQKIKETAMVISGRRNGKRFDYIFFNAVIKGKPLPKGHGDLIDRGALFVNSEIDYTEDGYGCIKLSDILTFPPIIGGDKEGEDDRD